MLKIDVARNEVRKNNGKEIRFSHSEFNVLVALARADGKVVTREQFQEHRPSNDSRTTDQSIARIRRKLGKEGNHFIRTVPYRGYKAKDLKIVG